MPWSPAAEPHLQKVPPWARLRRVAAGLLASAAALAGQWAAHQADGRAPFAPYSAAQWAVDRAPGTLATTAIDSLGHGAVPLVTGVAVLLALVVGASAAAVSPRTFLVTALLGTAIAAAADPHGPPILGTVVAAAVAAIATPLAAVARVAPQRCGGQAADGPSRRALLSAIAATVALVAVGGSSAVWAALHRVATGRVRADRSARVPTDPGFAEVPGLTPAVTTRDDHYVVAIDLDPPRVDAGSWRLCIGGAVRSPLALSLDDLPTMSTVEELVMLSCISNPVGGGLTGNARWTGVPLSALMATARILSSAVAVRAAAADGYHDTIVLADALRPEVLVAFGMDGELLTVAHGFPARLLVPGTYGMKNVKWLTDITILDSSEPGYWEARGWDTGVEARTESRFDVPVDHSDVPSPVLVAGIAWAGRRRITQVQVSADDGVTWTDALLEEELSAWAWRRWQLRLALPPGVHALTVRARDGAGALQDDARRAPHPSGASGHHRIVVTVR